MRNRCIRALRFARPLRQAGAIALLAALWLPAADARGQTVYRWTDARGVVHFSDSPPPPGTDAQVDKLPVAPPPGPQNGEAAADGVSPPAGEETTPVAAVDGAAADGSATLRPTRPATGPARIEVRDKQDREVEGTLREFTGSVKNTGGETARDIVVLISITEPVQGESCVREEAEVDPPVLGPGEVGSYSIQLESPCFLGPITTDVSPDWR